MSLYTSFNQVILTISQGAMPKLIAIAVTVSRLRILSFSWIQQQRC